jgi:hypothetical protein
MKVPFVSLYLFFISSITWAQLPTQGILKYQVDTVRRLDEYAGSMRLTDLAISYKDGGMFSKIYAGYPDNFAGNGDQIVLFRNETAFLAFQTPGDSLMVVQMPNRTPSASAYESVRTEETKRINSLKCRKWLIKDKSMGLTHVAWILEQNEIQIPINRYFTQFRGIEGLPVEFDMEMSEWLLHVRLQKIDATPIDNKAFEVPSGKNRTFDDFMQEMNHFKITSGQK